MTMHPTPPVAGIDAGEHTTADGASASARDLGRRVLALIIAEADALLGRCAELDDADGMEVELVRQDILLMRHEAIQAGRGLDRLAEPPTASFRASGLLEHRPSTANAHAGSMPSAAAPVGGA